jgi:hypothetical protein
MAVSGAEGAMKLFVIVLVFIWVVCGIAGAWMMDGAGDMHWRTIARGPISLIQAFQDDPVTIPTQN